MKKRNELKTLLSALIILGIILLFSQKIVYADAGTREDAVKWVYAQEGKFLDYDGAYGAQCVDLIKYYYAYFGKASYARGNGCDYVSNALPSGWTRIKNTADFIPEPGDIAVWGTELNKYGHVAIILSADLHSFISMDQNWPSGSACKQVTHNYNKFWGVIRPDFRTSAPTVNYPYGSLDSCSGGEGIINISGWAKDDDEPDTGIEIHVYIGGPSGSAGTEGHSGIYANQYRSDVGNHAYSATIKTNKTGTQDVYIYGINVGGGYNTLIASGTVTITPNNPFGSLDSCSGEEGGFNISGWAKDNDEPDTGIEIHVYVGSPSGTPGEECHSGIYANQYRSDVGNHAYSANIKTNKTGTQNIYIYGINVGGGDNTLIASGTVTITPNEAPKISNVKVTNVSKEGFDITCRVSDNYGISKVQFPTWTRENGQDDLVQDWTTNAICSGRLSGDTASYHVNTSDHNNETGLYYVHIYAFDKCGNRKNMTLAVYVGDDKYETDPIITEVYNGHVYMLFEGLNCDGEEQMDWSEAASYCQSIGGTLACITSEAENKIVASMVNKYGTPCWIGGNDLEQEGQFVWESGEPFSYTNWDAGEPNNAGEQNFIRMYTNGLWDDMQNNHYAFICEFDNMISTITYHLDGGVNNTENPDYYYVDNPYVKLSDPSKEGYLFEGWYLSENGTEAVTEETKLQGDVDIYARWIKDPVPKLSVQWDDGMVAAIVSNMDSAKSYGFVYGKGTDVTLETPGRTRIAYSEIDSNKRFSFDASGLTGCTIRTYVVYTDKNGDSQVIYSDPIER